MPRSACSAEYGDRIQFPKRSVLNKRTMDNVLNCDSYINIPSSQTYRSHLHLNRQQRFLNCGEVKESIQKE
jgi:hypothetical protein